MTRFVFKRLPASAASIFGLAMPPVEMFPGNNMSAEQQETVRYQLTSLGGYLAILARDSYVRSCTLPDCT